ncbi:MAG: hypothetical protein ACJAR2_001109 [Ilumatobacter sp.]|jgi:hypothetical protein
MACRRFVNCEATRREVLSRLGSIYQNSNGTAIKWEDGQRDSSDAGGAIFMAIGIV